jgi:hypothetical protein
MVGDRPISRKKQSFKAYMQLLILEATYRRWLYSKAALGFDRDLNEKFIGLTHNESIFFAQMSKVPLLPLGSLTLDELERFVNLDERHQHAYLA